MLIASVKIAFTLIITLLVVFLVSGVMNAMNDITSML